MEIPGPEWRADGGSGAIADAGGLHLYQLRLHAAYGPVVRFQLPGADTAVSIADPVLLEATAHLDERPERLFAFLDPLFETGNPQVMPVGEHAPWRRLLLSVLAGRASHEQHLPHFTALTVSLADRWAEHAGSAEGDDGRPIGLQKDLTALSLRMICAYALGGGEVTDPERVVSAFEDVLTAHLGRLYRTPEPGTREEEAGRNREAERAEAALVLLRQAVDRVIAAHHGGRRDRSDVVGALVEAGEEPARIRDTVMATMLAAHHTTGVAVSWALYLLALHPRTTERVTEELDRVLGTRAAPAYADLRRLVQLEMVLKEAMRLCPPGPYGARRTDTALVVGAYEIPPGTTVFYPFWAVCPGQEQAAAREITVTRWLAALDFPAVRPLAIDQPVHAAGRTATFWEELPLTSTAPPATSPPSCAASTTCPSRPPSPTPSDASTPSYA
ncbi:cytochrome P450 [Streptomyces uncialis]|uniref:cytochrome P450 n=1 Tax=Streptomyces uncialis TaxID=1048205 RepID=UPI00381CE98D